MFIKFILKEYYSCRIKDARAAWLYLRHFEIICFITVFSYAITHCSPFCFQGGIPVLGLHSESSETY